MTRIRITGESDLVSAIEETLRTHKDAEIVEPPHPADRTEQPFGIGDLETIVTILSGTAILVDYLLRAVRRLTRKKYKVRITSAVGAVTLEIDAKITEDELRRLLKPLEPGG